MAADLDKFDFRHVRPSPTNPHRKPISINITNIKTQQDRGGQSSRSSVPFGLQNGRPVDSADVDIDMRPGPSRPQFSMPETNEKFDQEKEGKVFWWVKFAFGILVVVIAIVGTVFFVLFYTHPNISKPESQGQQKEEETVTEDSDKNPPTVEQQCKRLNEEIEFNGILHLDCHLQNKWEMLNITFQPQYGSFRKTGGPISFSLKQTNVMSEEGWNITVNNETNVSITRQPAKCDSGGEYNFIFYNTTGKDFKHSETVEIESKVSDLELEVTSSNDSDFTQISCSARSACIPAPITLLGIFSGGESEPIFGGNFSCLISYNDDAGWSVRCQGRIPISVYSSLSSIACIPSTGNQTVDEEKKIQYDICRDCIFECPNELGRDQYFYDYKICNIYHRCFNKQLYTQPCGKGTYFNVETCTCDHTDNLPGKCDENNERVEKESKSDSCEQIQK